MMVYTHLEEKLSEIGAEVREKYKGKLKANGVYATGKLYNSVDYKLTVKEEGIELYFTALDYYINIEEGRKPNSKMPNVEEIKKWMVAKNIPNKPGLAFVIARSIGKKGIKPQPFLRETKVEIESLIPSIRTAIEMDLDNYMENNIKNKINEQ